MGGDGPPGQRAEGHSSRGGHSAPAGDYLGGAGTGRLGAGGFGRGRDGLHVVLQAGWDGIGIGVE